MESRLDRIFLSRRAFVAAAIAGGVALAGCGRPSRPSIAVGPNSSAVSTAEAARPHTGRTVTASLTPQPATIDLGGTLARTLAYGNTIPGPLIRANVGDELAVTVANRLNHPTSVHWHGIALRNDMDGAAAGQPEHRGRPRLHLPILVAASGHLLGPSRTPAWTPTTGCICR